MEGTLLVTTEVRRGLCRPKTDCAFLFLSICAFTSFEQQINIFMRKRGCLTPQTLHVRYVVYILSQRRIITCLVSSVMAPVKAFMWWATG